MKLTKETLETLRHIVNNAMIQTEDDFRRADAELKRTDSISALQSYEHYGEKYDNYRKAQEYVNSLEAEEWNWIQNQ